MLYNSMGLIRTILFSCLVHLIAGCVSVNNTNEHLNFDTALQHPGVITLPYTIEKYGLVLVENVKINGQNLTFALDTGATRSAIFESSLRKMKVAPVPHKDILIHGMIESETRNSVIAPNITIETHNFGISPLIVLVDRDLGLMSSQPYDGLLGMDILASYKIYFSKDTQLLKLIPTMIETPVPPRWKRVKLVDVPFGDSRRALHTMDIRLLGTLTTALFDTGAEFSVINWDAARHSQLKATKKRLKKEWQLQGAVGTFKPVSKVLMDRFRGGQKFWNNKEFIIMDLDNADIVVAPETPFAIAGMNLFWDETVLIDFQANYIALKPRTEERADIKYQNAKTNIPRRERGTYRP